MPRQDQSQADAQESPLFNIPFLISEQIGRIWDAQKDTRNTQTRNEKYYRGDQKILKSHIGQTRENGLLYNELVVNFTEDIINRHRGFVFGNPMSVTLEDQKADRSALNAYERIRKDNLLDAQDAENYQDSLLKGFSVEVHSFDSETKQIHIDRFDPREWAFVFDSLGAIVFAIRRAVIRRGTWVKKILTDVDFFQWWIYDAEKITVFDDRRSIIARPVGSTGTQQPAVPQFDEKTQSFDLSAMPSAVDDPRVTLHQYGQVPVIVWTSEKDSLPFISDAFISLQDAMNTAASSHMDDFTGDIGALLIATGFQMGEFGKMVLDEDGNSTGKTKYQQMQEMGALSIPSDSNAFFITRQLPFEKAKFTFAELRGFIFMLGMAPDLARAIGVTGQTTGVALKLQFQAQDEKSSISIKYIEGAVRQRIALINRIWGILGLPLLEDYKITFTFSIPVNEIERWQNIGFLADFLSVPDLLRLVGSINDPEAAWQRNLDELVDPKVRKAMIFQATINGKFKAEGDVKNGGRTDESGGGSAGSE